MHIMDTKNVQDVGNKLLISHASLQKSREVFQLLKSISSAYRRTGPQMLDSMSNIWGVFLLKLLSEFKKR